METKEAESEAFCKAQEAISPYVTSRQEAAHIRRVLTLHLKSHIVDNGGNTLTPPISLFSSSAALLPSAGKSQGLHKEYLKALKANVKAKQEYDGLSRPPSTSSDKTTEDVSLNPYLCLVRQRQKQERLRILQDYMEGLSSKSSAITSFLDEPSATMFRPPRLPADLITSASYSAPSSSVNLSDLIQDLEKVEIGRAHV